MLSIFRWWLRAGWRISNRAHSSDTPNESLHSTRRTCRRSGSALALHRAARASNCPAVPGAVAAFAVAAVFMGGESSRPRYLYQNVLI